MRIVRVITRLDVAGGAELSTLIEVEELATRGHTVEVVTLSEPATPAARERLERAGVAHRHLGGGGHQQVSALRRLLRDDDVDVAHAVILRAEVVVALAATGLPTSTVVSLVNTQYAPEAVAEAPSPRRLEVVRRLESLVLRRGIDRFHCLTDAAADHAVEHLGIARDRIVVVPRGRRGDAPGTDSVSLARLRDELAGPDDLLLVQVGRHERQKGQDLLLDAVERLRGRDVAVRLVIAGRDGNCSAALRERIARAGLEGTVELLGARTDVPSLLGAADLVCVSSRWEGLGATIIEALAVGAPIVAFATPAVSEVVGDAGALVEPFDIDAFADEVHRLAGDDATRSELSERARRRFEEHFEIGAVCDRIEELYRRTLRREPASDPGAPGRDPDRVVALGELTDAERAGWATLCARHGHGYFTGPVWCTTWYESFSPGADTRVGLWSDDGEITAVAAMVRVSEPLVPESLLAERSLSGGLQADRVMRRVAVPRWQNLGAGPGGADHGGFPCIPELRRSVLGWAAAAPSSVRLLDLDASWGPDLDAEQLSASGSTTTWEVDLDGTTRPGSKKLWKHIARSRRQLVESGVVFDVLVGSELDHGALAELFALHGMRSESVGRTSTFTGDRLAFHAALAQRSTDAQASFLVTARLAGVLVGALYGFLDGSTVSYFQSGWDPRHRRSSIGSVLIGEAIDLAVARGATTFDLLRGDEPYKLRFGATSVAQPSVLVARGTSGLALRARDATLRLRDARRARRSEEDSDDSGPSAAPTLALAQ